MNEIKQEIDNLINICQEEFTQAYIDYRKNPSLGHVIRDQEIPNTLTAILQFKYNYPNYSQKIDSWLQSLNNCRRQEILNNFDGCMNRINSLKQILN
ncbi:hypothetical protein Cal7507_3956 [Calothrix sp. PCC 7507]|nr:hypothetical protein Cal7507_3956 [Calothrix sp. PCC 7507]